MSATRQHYGSLVRSQQRDVTVEAQGVRQRPEFSPGAATAAELIGTVAQQLELRDVSVVEPSIEDLVRTLYSR